MADVFFHPEAQAEYEAASAWYEDRSTKAADDFENVVERVLELICDRPLLFPRYDHRNHYAGLGRFPFKVVYQLQGEEIYVVALAHYSRNPGYWKNRDH